MVDVSCRNVGTTTTRIAQWVRAQGRTLMLTLTGDTLEREDKMGDPKNPPKPPKPPTPNPPRPPRPGPIPH